MARARIKETRSGSDTKTRQLRSAPSGSARRRRRKRRGSHRRATKRRRVIRLARVAL